MVTDTYQVVLVQLFGHYQGLSDSFHTGPKEMYKIGKHHGHFIPRPHDTCTNDRRDFQCVESLDRNQHFPCEQDADPISCGRVFPSFMKI